MDLKEFIRDVPDFPEPGILFKDITPLLGNAKAFDYTISRLVDRYKDTDFDAIVPIMAGTMLSLIGDLGSTSCVVTP